MCVREYMCLCMCEYVCVSPSGLRREGRRVRGRGPRERVVTVDLHGLRGRENENETWH